jgi:hypothetical protein
MWMDFECETLFLAKTRGARQHFFLFFALGLLDAENFGKLFLSFCRLLR